MRSTLLGGYSKATFMQCFWQKEPLLIRGAWPGFVDPLSPEELAGLAMEEGIHARLVMERGGKKPWQLQHGPFSESQLRNLPRSHWSLLVSQVDQWVEPAALLLDRFNFIPNWRLDDLMVSFAPPMGSVGPHVDSYDVFLIQGQGRRRWSIQKNYDPTLKRGVDLKILRSFSAEADWILEPGDMLYLPPGVAHHGVALTDCMTYSVGFRAPEQAALLGDLFNLPSELTKLCASDDLYSDPDAKPARAPGELTLDAVARVRAMVSKPLEHPELLGRWLGQFLTRADQNPQSVHKAAWDSPKAAPRRVSLAGIAKWLESGRSIWRSDDHRVTYFAPKGALFLYIDGEEWPLDVQLKPLVEGLLSARQHQPNALRALLPARKGRAQGLELLQKLTRRGAIYQAR